MQLPRNRIVILREAKACPRAEGEGPLHFLAIAQRLRIAPHDSEMQRA
jgi:hypothetical protein